MEGELDHRIAAAWASFAKFKPELCDQRLSAKLRAKLFNSVVSSRVLYGSSSWTLTVEREAKLTTVRWRMLRMMFARRWRGEAQETWPDYVRDVMHRVETISSKLVVWSGSPPRASRNGGSQAKPLLQTMAAGQSGC